MSAMSHRWIVNGSVTVLLILMAGLGGACRGSSRSAEAPPIERSTTSPTYCVKVAVLADQTGSRNYTRTEDLTTTALEPIIELLRGRCGELLVGAIRDRSNQPFGRLAIPPGPPSPTPPADGNVFDVLDAKAVYDQEMARYQSELPARSDLVEQRIQAFRQEVTTLAKQPLAHRSAVWEAISRADVALAEPEPPGRSSTGRRYIIAGSDVHDTTGAQARPLASGATLVVANGAGTLGSLASVPGVKAFESLSAALLWVSETEGATPSAAERVR